MNPHLTKIPIQQEWLDKAKFKVTASSRLGNPCVPYYGQGPEGVTCKKCVHLHATGRSRRYLKCDLRNYTRGKGSDHKAGWLACAKYEGKA